MNRLQLLAQIFGPANQAARTLGASAVLWALLSSSAPAQKKGEKVRVLAGSALRTAPGGQVVGVLSRTFEAPVDMVQGAAIRLKLSGFVLEQEVRLEGNRMRGQVGAAGGKADVGGTLRLGPSEKEPALATLNRGAVVFSTQKSAAYLAVNRTVWIDKSRLAKFNVPAPAPKPTAPAPSAPKPELQAIPVAQTTPPAATPTIPNVAQGRGAAPSLPFLQTVGTPALRSGPDGNVVTTLPEGAVVTPLATDNGWTRVRVEGWVQTKDLTEATEKALGTLSAADLRADPSGTKGRIVRWTVEALSYQLADGLRRELNGEPYILARGPGKERAILYLAVPDSLVEAARALTPLSTVTVTARVRSGRSQPGGVPILDLLELTRR